MTPYSVEEKQWFVSQWLSGKVPHPNPLTGVIVLPEDVASLRYRTFQQVHEALAYLTALP